MASEIRANGATIKGKTQCVNSATWQRFARVVHHLPGRRTFVAVWPKKSDEARGPFRAKPPLEQQSVWSIWDRYARRSTTSTALVLEGRNFRDVKASHFPLALVVNASLSPTNAAAHAERTAILGTLAKHCRNAAAAQWLRPSYRHR